MRGAYPGGAGGGYAGTGSGAGAGQAPAPSDAVRGRAPAAHRRPAASANRRDPSSAANEKLMTSSRPLRFERASSVTASGIDTRSRRLTRYFVSIRPWLSRARVPLRCRRGHPSGTGHARHSTALGPRRPNAGGCECTQSAEEDPVKKHFHVIVALAIAAVVVLGIGAVASAAGGGGGGGGSEKH